ncbi:MULTISPECIES: winged helix-turn-helix domain-containing protein [Proteus]|uniref:Winged helix-turn-helix domain-containing protein n=1 Tax=Proteus penneri TaxID=102862 RepID=A0ABS0VZF0_9GAMM|nr:MULTISPECIES: winged helix-turn-helix domain-containing protein [Proteus]MBJ2116418.1 winged helix-turn-helix domain-containing protein [Proteus penneri]NBM13194.1 hypothetical protein [Proteus sp. G2670]NBM34349.1 hypothetical protein [Proteus sp. G2664]NBM67806.1 hypothetical protein [Proteus sp. G2663]SUC00678.1 Transcriptional regulatory protein, C terminal [Proteus penneri]
MGVNIEIIRNEENLRLEDEKYKDKIRYLIEDAITYFPSENVLFSNKTGEEIKLLASASECFHFLLKNQGKLISKPTLIEVGWGQYALHVSDSTFYQNILNLRKGIKECGVEGEVIKTVPRKGLLIPDNIKVSFILKNDENNFLHDEAEAEIKEFTSPSNNATSEIRSNNINYLGEHRKLVCILIILIFIILGSLGCYLNYPINYVSNYHYVGGVNGCDVNVKEKNINVIKIKDFLIRESIDCNVNKFVYITTYQNVKKLSLISCQYPLDDYMDNKCTSYYYMDKRL